MIHRWPDTNQLPCGCRVGLKREGQDDVLLYFPCDSKCPTVEMTKRECEKAGKQWEVRNVNNN